MKKRLLIFLLSPLLLGSCNVMAQSWVNGGNALTASGILGTTTNFSVLFRSNNTERGRLTSGGLWGFGTSSPDSKVHINSASGQTPFRVQVNGSTKFFINSNGGISVGNSTTAPVNGLFVSGNVGIGTATPDNRLHVFNGSAGAVTGFPFASLIVENSTHNFINMLAPDDAETGILFGKPSSNVSGGIIYNSVFTGAPNGLQFRTNGNITRMTLTKDGNLGVGTDPEGFKLRIKQSGGGGFAIESTFTQDHWEFFIFGSRLDLFFNGLTRGSFNSTSGAYTSVSDERLKTNIKPMSAMLQKIMQLKPSTYQFKNSTDKQEYNGFIAQEVMTLFPAMVTHSVNPKRNLDVYTMDYSQFGVLAIKGIQELLPVIEEQKEKIATLEDRLAKLEAALSTITSHKNGNVPGVIANASLEQNQPNPFTNNTTIRYRIPKGNKGQINIYDQTGKIVKTLIANESGQSALSGSDLAAGAYTYTLLINGKVALSKQMLIIK